MFAIMASPRATRMSFGLVKIYVLNMVKWPDFCLILPYLVTNGGTIIMIVHKRDQIHSPKHVLFFSSGLTF